MTIAAYVRRAVKDEPCATANAIIELFSEDVYFVTCPEFREEIAAMLGEMGLAEVIASEVLN